MTSNSFQGEGRKWFIKRPPFSPLMAPISAVLTICAIFVTLSLAHPGSGIVIDQQGHIFFQDSLGRIVWKIDEQGQLTKFFQGKGGHWMCLDAKGSFARGAIKYFERITPDGFIPALIFADGGAPIVVTRSGKLYYPSHPSQEDEMSPGGQQLAEMLPNGKRTLFAPELKVALEKLNEGVTGLAAGADDTLYVASDSAVFKIKSDGRVTTLAHPTTKCDGDSDLRTRFLRGLDVSADGIVYVADTGCGSVVKITPDGQAKPVLRVERPWSPTGIALQGSDIYILEYTNAMGHANDGWLPRVRKLGRDGKALTLATISKEARERS